MDDSKFKTSKFHNSQINNYIFEQPFVTKQNVKKEKDLLSVDDDSFKEQVLDSRQLVLVDFWAPWCEPCKKLIPTLQEIQKMMPDLKIIKINIDENEKIPCEYNVSAIPALFLIYRGSVISQQNGALTKNDLVKWIEKTLSVIITKYNLHDG